MAPPSQEVFQDSLPKFSISMPCAGHNKNLAVDERRYAHNLVYEGRVFGSRSVPREPEEMRWALAKG